MYYTKMELYCNRKSITKIFLFAIDILVYNKNSMDENNFDVYFCLIIEVTRL